MKQKNTTYILRQDWHALLNSLTHINCKFISLCLKQRHVEDLSVSDWKQSVLNQDVFKYIQNDVVNGFLIHILLETANFAIRYEVKIIYPY